MITGVKFASALLMNCTLLSGSADIPETAALMVRGHQQTLRLYGARTGSPVIVSSGDGGWIHLAPLVAQQLAARGFFVVGFDTRAYLASFMSGRTTLRVEDEPSDYRAVIHRAPNNLGEFTERPLEAIRWVDEQAPP